VTPITLSGSLSSALAAVLAGLPAAATGAFDPAWSPEWTANASPACTVVGSPVDDVLIGTSGDDVLCGLEGNDQLDGQGGNDVLDGGPGNDGLKGGDGSDVATYEAALQGVVADMASGTAGEDGTDVLAQVEGLIGSPSDDVLAGSGATNSLSGLGGTDLLFGRGGPDTLLGGDGDDYLTGSDGSLLDGGEGTDTCRPGSGSVASLSCLSPHPADENDAHGFLDVKQIDSFLESEQPVWRIITVSRWSVSKMWDRGFALVYLDTFGADVSDYYALIRSVGRRLRAELYRNGHRIASLRVWRRNRRSVSMRIPLGKLLTGETRAFYRWRVVTITDRCRRACFDRVPNEGALVQPLPGLG
jgi:hypothetical protein